MKWLVIAVVALMSGGASGASVRDQASEFRVKVSYSPLPPDRHTRTRFGSVLGRFESCLCALGFECLLACFYGSLEAA